MAMTPTPAWLSTSMPASSAGSGSAPLPMMALVRSGTCGRLATMTGRCSWSQVAGVSRVLVHQSSTERATFEVESLKDKFIRGDLARAVVEAGWNLNELRPASMSLEEIFLQLTGSDPAKGPAPLPPAEENVPEVNQ